MSINLFISVNIPIIFIWKKRTSKNSHTKLVNKIKVTYISHVYYIINFSFTYKPTRFILFLVIFTLWEKLLVLQIFTFWDRWSTILNILTIIWWILTITWWRLGICDKRFRWGVVGAGRGKLRENIQYITGLNLNLLYIIMPIYHWHNRSHLLLRE